MRLLVFIVALFSIGLALTDKYDHFQFDITLFCNERDRKEYNLVIEWRESDTLPGKEQISRSKYFNASTGNFSFTMDGAMDGDEIGSAGYRPVAYITHDCERELQEVELALYVDTLCDIGRSCHYRIIEDITNRKGTDYITAKALKLDDWTPFPDFHPS
uniref:Uncharacterized protein n=1 Tax=Caenorhabditis tropicalis TaxID=1561998 RepID=A0A1I7UNI2_9PELO